MKKKFLIIIMSIISIISAYITYIYGKINFTHDPYFVKKQLLNFQGGLLQIDLNNYDSLIVYNYIPNLEDFCNHEPSLFFEYKNTYKKLCFYDKTRFISPYSNRIFILLIYYKNKKTFFKVSDTKYANITYYFGGESDDILKKHKYVNGERYTIHKNFNYYYILDN